MMQSRLRDLTGVMDLKDFYRLINGHMGHR